MSEHRVVIAGGGVIGVCCAYFLSKAGADVTLVDRDEIGKAASFGNAGTVAAGHPPLNKPSRIHQSLKLLLDPKSPLYIPVRWDPGLTKWLWTFRKFSTAEHLRVSMGALAPLGHVTLDLFDQLVETEGLDCTYRRGGYYEICRTESGLEGGKRDAAMMQDHGYTPRVLSGGELQEIEPALLDGVVGGIHFPDAATCDPYRFVVEMAARAVGYGAQILTGRGVVEIESTGGGVKGVRLSDGDVIEADSVVLATGAYSQELTRKFGLQLPVQGGKGYHRDLPASAAPAMNIHCVLAETSVFCTPLDDFTRLAGTLEFSGLNHDLHRGRLDQLTSAAREYLSGVGDAEPRSEWCGLRPCTPDGMPYVGPVPGQDGLFVATGHAMLGLTLGPVTGQIISEQVLEGRTTLPAGALGVDRL